MVLDTIVKRVWLQREAALCDASLDASGSLVEYHVPGFGSQLVIQDRRAKGVKAYEATNTPEGLSRFPESFDFPSRVIVTGSGNATTVEPLDGGQGLPECDLLWIAAGIEPIIPAWDYVWDVIAEVDSDLIAYVAIANTTAGRPA